MKSFLISESSGGIMGGRQLLRARFFVLGYENDRYGEFT
jgi:hypothetical protein